MVLFFLPALLLMAAQATAGAVSGIAGALTGGMIGTSTAGIASASAATSAGVGSLGTIGVAMPSAFTVGTAVGGTLAPVATAAVGVAGSAGAFTPDMPVGPDWTPPTADLGIAEDKAAQRRQTGVRKGTVLPKTGATRGRLGSSTALGA